MFLAFLLPDMRREAIFRARSLGIWRLPRLSLLRLSRLQALYLPLPRSFKLVVDSLEACIHGDADLGIVAFTVLEAGDVGSRRFSGGGDVNGLVKADADLVRSLADQVFCFCHLRPPTRAHAMANAAHVMGSPGTEKPGMY